jgi:hypothetical protein
MRINSVCTKAKFKATGRTISGWAAAKGHNPGTTSNLIHGHIPVPADLATTPSGRIIADLREDGLLVTDEDEAEEEAA